MTHEAIPVQIPDLSAFARSMARELAARAAANAGPPGHVETLNLVAHALGHRNVQALRAGLRAPRALRSRAADEAPPALTERARRTLRHFDAQGRLMRWPKGLAVQRLALWVLWTRFDGKRLYTEREVNAIVREAHGFADHATLRRELVNHQLLARKADCSEYRKLAARPDAETRALLSAWRATRER